MEKTFSCKHDEELERGRLERDEKIRKLEEEGRLRIERGLETQSEDGDDGREDEEDGLCLTCFCSSIVFNHHWAWLCSMFTVTLCV